MSCTKGPWSSYPLMKNINGLSDTHAKPLPGTNANGILKPIYMTVVMGSTMDGHLLKAATAAHHTSIGSFNAHVVTSTAYYAALTTALAKAIASVPSSQVMDVYNGLSRPGLHASGMMVVGQQHYPALSSHLTSRSSFVSSFLTNAA